MPDFKFIQDKVTGMWIVLAPRRAKRPDESHDSIQTCPFCPSSTEEALFEIVGESSLPHVAEEGLEQKKPHPNPLLKGEGVISESSSNWLVKVIANKYPFAPNHEVIISSPDHHKSFSELPEEHIQLILKAYQNRYLVHQNNGQVYIFHNHGIGAGESIPHAHTQLVTIPHGVQTTTPRLPQISLHENTEVLATRHFVLYCPETSQWPDEVWIVPKERGSVFGDITEDEINDFAFVLKRLITILDYRHGNEFPYNFYIYPGADWYLRIIPRIKSLGGFELGTGVFVNTQDPKETMEFIKTHFDEPDLDLIKKRHQADYKKHI